MRPAEEQEIDSSNGSKPNGPKTFRSAEPVGRGTMSLNYVQALKEVRASTDLIEWAEEKANGHKAN